MIDQEQVPQVPQQAPPQQRQNRQLRSRGVAEATWRLFVFLVVFFVPTLLCAGLAVLYAYSSGVIVVEDYYFLLCLVPLFWFIIAWIIAAQAYVVPDNQRLVVFRMGKRRPKALGPGIAQLVPFIDEIVSRVDRRQQTQPVQFNRVPLLASAGEGYILCDPELQLFITYLQGKEHLSVLEVRDVMAQIKAQAGGAIRSVTANFTVDDAQKRAPELIEQIQDAINEFAEDWGISVRVEISDWNFPDILVQAWTESEQAETRAKAQQVLADARQAIVKRYLEAAQQLVNDDASKREVGQVALQLYMADVAQSFSAGGALPLLNLQDFLRGQQEKE